MEAHGGAAAEAVARLVRCGFLHKPWSTWSAVGNLTSRAGELRSASSGPDPTWSTWSAVINRTSRAGELRSAPSEPDDWHRVTG